MKAFLKRLGIALLSLLLLAYVGYQIFQSLYSNVTVESVVPYSVYETIETQVIAIRTEQPVEAEVGDKHLFYALNNGDRISKGGTIAELFDDESAAGIQRRLEMLNEDIALLENVEALGENGYSSLEAINQQLSSAALAVSVRMHETTTEGLRSLRSQLLSLLNKRQVVVGTGTDFTDQLAILREQRSRLENQLRSATGSVLSPVAGYFINTVDGYETYFPTDEEEIAALTPAAIKEALNAHPTAPSDCVGKVAGDFGWYLACVIPGDQSARLTPGGTLKVRLPFVTGEAISTKVLAVNSDASGEAAVLLRCNLMSEELASVRIQTAQLLLTEHSGMRLPDKALQFDKENRTGAYVRIGTTISFRYVTVAYHDEKDGYSICEITDEDGYVKLYDDVIVGGKNLYDGKVVRS